MQINLTKEEINRLPAATGIYIFKNHNEILYVGKAISIKARILSHLESAKLDPKEALIFKNSNVLEYILTDSEFKALLLESTLIQKHQPKYNSRWKDNKSYLYIKVTSKEEFPKVFIVRKENDSRSLYFGPFPSRRDTEKILSTTRRIFPFCTQKKITKQPCFYSKIGLCNPCPNSIVKNQNEELKKIQKDLYINNIKTLVKILKGNVELVLQESYKLLKKLAAEEKFEDALYLRNHIQRFEQLIQQTQFSSDITKNYNLSSSALEDLTKILARYLNLPSPLKRIECYDISNLLQKEATAAMVVFTDGMPDKSQYRRFKIKNLKLKSDFEMLEEIFIRRFKHNWPQPDLIVVDGGTPQVLKVKNVMSKLKSKPSPLNPIPLIGIAKHPDRLVISTQAKLITIRPSLNSEGFNMIRSVRDEAHRFAKKYHLLLRNQKMDL